MENNQPVETLISQAVNPLVFISHDTRDAELAEAFSTLLKSVSAGVLKSFRSSDRKGNQGIEFGVEWYPAIIKEIQAASDVVCLLTERSVNRPWILFEAGMAKGKLDTPILGVALGIELQSASTGPFAQFQNCADDDESLTKLVFQLVDRIPGSEPDRDTIRFQVEKFKSTIKPVLETLATSSPTQASAEKQQMNEIANSSAMLFEEIKIMFKDLPMQIERSQASRTDRKQRRMTPKMLDGIRYKVKGSSLVARIILSMFKETMPWVYDEGCMLLQNMQSAQSSSNRKQLVSEFEKNLFLSTRIPYFEDILVDPEEDLHLLRTMPKILMEQLYALSERDPKEGSDV